jgi:hypothetical protein
MSDDALRAVEAAAALTPVADFEHEHSGPALQSAVARAVLEGASISDVAAAAHMTPLEVLDATDAAGYHSQHATERGKNRNTGHASAWSTNTSDH